MTKLDAAYTIDRNEMNQSFFFIYVAYFLILVVPQQFFSCSSLYFIKCAGSSKLSPLSSFEFILFFIVVLCERELCFCLVDPALKFHEAIAFINVHLSLSAEVPINKILVSKLAFDTQPSIIKKNCLFNYKSCEGYKCRKSCKFEGHLNYRWTFGSGSNSKLSMTKSTDSQPSI